MTHLSDPRHIVVADENLTLVTFVVDTLREDGHAVFPAYDAPGANRVALALDHCDLVVTNTRVEGVPSLDLVEELHQRRPHLPVLYLAHAGASTPEVEARLPARVQILREPFTAAQLRSVVNPLLGL